MAGKKKSQNRINRRHNESHKIETVGSFDTDIWGKVFIVVGVLVFLLLFYLLALYITNKNTTDDKKDEKEEVTISYEEIPIGRSFSMSDDDYYVIYYDFEDEDTKEKYDELVSTYNGREDHITLYKVNMGSGININRSTSEETNKNPSDASELKINGPTLIKYSNHSVSEYYEGEEDVSNHLS